MEKSWCTEQDFKTQAIAIYVSIAAMDSVRLMAGHRVKPYVVGGNKDDKVDAAAICEAVGFSRLFFLAYKG
jgi:hypothetical protein